MQACRSAEDAPVVAEPAGQGQFNVLNPPYLLKSVRPKPTPPISLWKCCKFLFWMCFI